MAAGPLLLVVLVIAVVAVVAVLAYQADQKRRALLQGFALSNRWTYTARDDSWCERFVGTPFGEGDNRRATNILAGDNAGSPMVAFDYVYETHSTDSKGNRSTTHHRFAVCSLQMRAPLPGLQLTPESAFSRLAGHLGFGDVELESEDFNRRYRVTARDPKFASDVLHPRTMALLLSRPALNLRLLDVEALSWESGRLQPADLLARLSTMHAVLDGIPSFVWSDHALPVDHQPVEHQPVEQPPGGTSA
jgi:hypothetical protein